MAKFKYFVDVKEVWDTTVEIESDVKLSRPELEDLANQKMEDGDTNDMEYNRTLYSETWTCRDDEGNFI